MSRHQFESASSERWSAYHPEQEEVVALRERRGANAGVERRFTLVHAGTWVVAAGLQLMAGTILGTRVVSELTVGVLLLAVLGAVLLGTAWWFDRESRDVGRTAAQRGQAYTIFSGANR